MCGCPMSTSDGRGGALVFAGAVACLRLAEVVPAFKLVFIRASTICARVLFSPLPRFSLRPPLRVGVWCCSDWTSS